MNIPKKIGILVASVCLVALISGCAGIDKTLYKQQVVEVSPARTIESTNYVTNIVVALPAYTNVQGQVIPAVTESHIQPVVTSIVLPAVYQTNLVDNPAVVGGVGIVQSLPIPFAAIIGLALTAALGVYKSVRNKKVSEGLVQSIQAGRTFLSSTTQGQQVAEQFKNVLMKAQINAGVANEVKGILDDIYPDHTTPKATVL